MSISTWSAEYAPDSGDEEVDFGTKRTRDSVSRHTREEEQNPAFYQQQENARLNQVLFDYDAETKKFTVKTRLNNVWPTKPYLEDEFSEIIYTALERAKVCSAIIVANILPDKEVSAQMKWFKTFSKDGIDNYKDPKASEHTNMRSVRTHLILEAFAKNPEHVPPEFALYTINDAFGGRPVCSHIEDLEKKFAVLRKEENFTKYAEEIEREWVPLHKKLMTWYRPTNTVREIKDWYRYFEKKKAEVKTRFGRVSSWEYARIVERFPLSAIPAFELDFATWIAFKSSASEQIAAVRETRQVEKVQRKLKQRTRTANLARRTREARVMDPDNVVPRVKPADDEDEEELVKPKARLLVRGTLEDIPGAPPPEVAEEPASTPREFALKPWQVDNVRRCWEAHQHKLGGVLFADGPGMGKTISAIYAAKRIPTNEDPRFCIICPTAVVSNWKEEIVRYGKYQSSNVAIFKTSFNSNATWTIINDSVQRIRAVANLNTHFDVCIVDEIHVFGRTSKVQQSEPGAEGNKGRNAELKRLCAKAGIVIGLSGTPRGGSGWASLITIARDYLKQDLSPWVKMVKERANKKPTNLTPEQSANIVKGVKEMLIVHDKAVLKLLPRYEYTVPYKPTRSELLQTKVVIDAHNERLAGKNKSALALVNVASISQVHPYLVNFDLYPEFLRAPLQDADRRKIKKDVKKRQSFAAMHPSTRFVTLLSLLAFIHGVDDESIPQFDQGSLRLYPERCEGAISLEHQPQGRRGSKTIVFAYNNTILFSALEYVTRRLDKSFRLFIYTSDTKTEERDRRLKEFVTTPDDKDAVIFVAMMSGGTGVNIQAATSVIFLQTVAQRYLHEQCTARAYRNGQAQVVETYYITGGNFTNDNTYYVRNHGDELKADKIMESLINDPNKTISDADNVAIDEDNNDAEKTTMPCFQELRNFYSNYKPDDDVIEEIPADNVTRNADATRIVEEAESAEVVAEVIPDDEPPPALDLGGFSREASREAPIVID